MSNLESHYNDPEASPENKTDREIVGTEKIPFSYYCENSDVYHNLKRNPTMTPHKQNIFVTQGLDLTDKIDDGLEQSYKLDLLTRSQPDGIAMASPPFTEINTPPTYVKWAEKLRNLLDDDEGVRLFQSYLRAEDCQDSLDFWLACQGLKTKPAENDEEIAKMAQIIRVIYRRYIRSSTKLPISKETRERIQEQICNKNNLQDQHVFDVAQAEVEASINNTTYLNFLKSDIYLKFVQKLQSEGCNSPKCGDGSSSDTNSEDKPCSGYLQTVNENEELQMEYHTPATLPLTLHHLQMTQRKRAGYAESLSHYSPSEGQSIRNPYHAMYASCIPVSAQDSELQSLSSGAHTDDTLSQTDSSVDGIPTFSSKKYLKHQNHAIKMNAKQNLEKDYVILPRSMRMSTAVPTDPKVFANLLIERLETVKVQQEREGMFQERFERNEGKLSGKIESCPLGSLPAGILKMNISEDTPSQTILDDHIDRVFEDCIDHSYSTSNWTPSLQSPESRRGTLPMTSYTGNAHHKHNHQHSNKTKLSKSPGELVNHSLKGSYPENFNAERERHCKEYHRHSYSRKTSSNSNEDSGIAISHDQKPVVSPNANSRERVIWWVYGNEKFSSSHHPDSEKDSSTKHRRSSHSSASAGSPVPNRQSRMKKPVMYNSSRSGSLERRPLGNTWPVPSQPFVQDPAMPILPPPNTTTQLEEVSRRLEDNAKSKLNRNKSALGMKEKIIHVDKVRKVCQGKEYSEENGNGLRKSKKSTPAPVIQNSENDYTVVGYYFCDEKFPYRTKLCGKNITLRQFKTLITKKGNYRYFFQCQSNEFGSECVNEEVTDDNAVLPLWEGKIVAHVKLIEDS